MFMQEMKQIVSYASCSKFVALHPATSMSGILANLPGLLSPQFLGIPLQVEKNYLHGDHNCLSMT